VFERRGKDARDFSAVNSPAISDGPGVWTVLVVQMLLCHDRNIRNVKFLTKTLAIYTRVYALPTLHIVRYTVHEKKPRRYI
jgi:hypothetical protein